MVQRSARTVLIALGFFLFGSPLLAAAQEATPTATPLPTQDTPAGVPTGFDEAIATPTPPAGLPTPTPTLEQIGMPADHDDFFGKSRPTEDEWDPHQVFPGNYYAFPLTLDVGWRPCLDCSGNVYRRPGAVTIWAGYAFQPYARVSSPYVAIGLEAIVAGVEEGGATWRGRSRLTPTLRTGWNFSAASVYSVAGVILPEADRGQKRPGYHVGLGASSFAFLALAACTAEAIPSVVEVGADFVDDPKLGRTKGQWTLKVGWGF